MSGRRRTVAAGLAGLAVGAAAVAIAWAASGGSSTKSGAGAPLTAPRTLGAYESLPAAAAHLDKAGKADAARLAAWAARSTALLSQAYGGKPALVAKYVDSQLETFVTLFVVRSPSPAPFYEYQDAAELGLARPTNEVRVAGDSLCGLQNQPTAVGQTPAPATILVVTCQRSAPNLTVFVHVAGDTLEHDPARVAALVDDAWRSFNP